MDGVVAPPSPSGQPLQLPLISLPPPSDVDNDDDTPANSAVEASAKSARKDESGVEVEERSGQLSLISCEELTNVEAAHATSIITVLTSPILEIGSSGGGQPCTHTTTSSNEEEEAGNHHHHHQQQQQQRPPPPREGAELRSRNVYFGKLPLTFTSPQLEEFARRYGSVERTKVSRSRDGASCFGFALFGTDEGAHAAIRALNGVLLPGAAAPIEVRTASANATCSIAKQHQNRGTSSTATMTTSFTKPPAAAAAPYFTLVPSGNTQHMQQQQFQQQQDVQQFQHPSMHAAPTLSTPSVSVHDVHHPLAASSGSADLMQQAPLVQFVDFGRGAPLPTSAAAHHTPPSGNGASSSSSQTLSSPLYFNGSAAASFYSHSHSGTSSSQLPSYNTVSLQFVQPQQPQQVLAGHGLPSSSGYNGIGGATQHHSVMMVMPPPGQPQPQPQPQPQFVYYIPQQQQQQEPRHHHHHHHHHTQHMFAQPQPPQQPQFQQPVFMFASPP